MKVTPPEGGLPPEWLPWASVMSSLVTATTQSGSTANRPTSFLYTGRMYFDTDLGHPIWYDGSGWVDATGTSA